MQEFEERDPHWVRYFSFDRNENLAFYVRGDGTVSISEELLGTIMYEYAGFELADDSGAA